MSVTFFSCDKHIWYKQLKGRIIYLVPSKGLIHDHFGPCAWVEHHDGGSGWQKHSETGRPCSDINYPAPNINYLPPMTYFRQLPPAKLLFLKLSQTPKQCYQLVIKPLKNESVVTLTYLSCNRPYICTFFIHSPVDGYLCFFPIVTSATMHICYKYWFEFLF